MHLEGVGALLACLTLVVSPRPNVALPKGFSLLVLRRSLAKGLGKSVRRQRRRVFHLPSMMSHSIHHHIASSHFGQIGLGLRSLTEGVKEPMYEISSQLRFGFQQLMMRTQKLT